MEGDSQSGDSQHRKVVGTVSNGYRLSNINLLYLSDQTEEFGFSFAVKPLFTLIYCFFSSASAIAASEAASPEDAGRISATAFFAVRKMTGVPVGAM